MAEPARPLSQDQPPQSEPQTRFAIRPTITLKELVELLDRLDNGYGGDSEKIYDREIDGAVVGSVFTVVNHDDILRFDTRDTPYDDHNVYPGDLSALLESIVEYLYQRSLPYAQLTEELRPSQSDDPAEQELKSTLLELEGTLGDERQVPTDRPTQIDVIQQLLRLTSAAYQRFQPEAEQAGDDKEARQDETAAGLAAAGAVGGAGGGAAGAEAESGEGDDKTEPTDQQPAEELPQEQQPRADIQHFTLDETAGLVLELTLDGLYRRLGFANREPRRHRAAFRYQAKAILAGELAIKSRHLTQERLFNALNAPPHLTFFNPRALVVTATDDFQRWLTAYAGQLVNRVLQQALAEKPAEAWLNDIALRVNQLVASIDDADLQKQLEDKVNAAPQPVATLQELVERFGAESAAELYQRPAEELYQALSQDRTLRVFERQLEVLLQIYLENQGLSGVSLRNIPAPLRQSFDREIERYLQSLSSQELIRLADPGNVEFRRLILLRFNNSLLRHQLSPLVMIQLDQYVAARQTLRRQTVLRNTKPVLVTYLRRQGLGDLQPEDVPEEIKISFAEEVRAQLRGLEEERRTTELSQAELNQLLADRLERNQTQTELVPQLHNFIDQRLLEEQQLLEGLLDQALADPGGLAVLNANTTVDTMQLALSGTGDHPENFIDALNTVDKLNQVFGLNLPSDTSVADVERLQQLLKAYWDLRRRQHLHRLKVELDTQENLPAEAQNHLQGYLDAGQPVHGMFVGLYSQEDVGSLSQAEADSQEFQLYSQRLRQARALVAFYKAQARQHLQNEEMLVTALATPYFAGREMFSPQLYAQGLLPPQQYPQTFIDPYLDTNPTADASQIINHRLLYPGAEEAAVGPQPAPTEGKSLLGKLGSKVAGKAAQPAKDAITNQLNKLTPGGAAEQAAMQGLKAVPYVGTALAGLDAAAKALRAFGVNIDTKKLIGILGGAAAFLIFKALAAMFNSLLGLAGGLGGLIIGFSIGGPVGGLVGLVAGAHLGDFLASKIGFGPGELLGLSGDGGGGSQLSTAQTATQADAGGVAAGVRASFASPVFTTTIGAGAVATGFFVYAATAGTFLQPLPTITPEGDVSPFVSIEKSSDPIPNDGSFDIEELPITITYTISIQPKRDFTLTINSITDTITTNYNRDEAPNASKESIQRTGSDFGFDDLENEPVVLSPQDDPIIITYTQQYDQTYLHSNVTNRFSISFTVDDEIDTEQAETAEVLCFGECPQFQSGCWPTSGVITQGVGGGFSHRTSSGGPLQAVDIAARADSNLQIYATQTGQACNYSQGNGVYRCQGSLAGCYGNNVVLSTDGGFDLLYAHLSAFAPGKRGGSCSAVEPGDVIGVMGSTGNSSGVHLHYEIPPSFNILLANIVPDPSLTQDPAPRVFVRSCYDFQSQ